MKNKLLTLRNISKEYNKNNEKIKVINNISFDVYEGEILSIIGTSGCGKSTLFNIIAHLIKDYDGLINYYFNDEDIGYMFQNDALFPWLNIDKNVRLGCNIKKINNDNYINNLMKRFKLSDFQDKFPHELSGGMKQRVSLIRTIATKPKLLLLDEPFAALDYQSRLSISKDVFNLIKENNITAIIITHDLAEAISLSDRVIVLSKRPAVIKNTYEIMLEKNDNPIIKRKDKRFNYYYELLCKDLDLLE
jgi:NitT/TauT family transport system ATP-binding protein